MQKLGRRHLSLQMAAPGFPNQHFLDATIGATLCIALLLWPETKVFYGSLSIVTMTRSTITRCCCPPKHLTQ